jgi:hypothetical protein
MNHVISSISLEKFDEIYYYKIYHSSKKYLIYFVKVTNNDFLIGYHM